MLTGDHDKLCTIIPALRFSLPNRQIQDSIPLHITATLQK